MSKKKAKKKEFSIDDVDGEEDGKKQMTPDQAALVSETVEFNGSTLNPFSKNMQSAADSLGAKICSTDFYECAEQLQYNNSYPGMFEDAKIIVWICSQPKSVWKKAARIPKWGAEKIDAWWEDEGGNIGSLEYGNLISAFGDIITPVFAVQAETESGKGGKSGGSKGLGES